MRRRDFIASLGGAAALSVHWSMSASAQQSGRPKRIAILMGVKEGDPEGIGRYAALVAGLKERGWIDGDTAKFESYWAGGSVTRIREIVPGLVASVPDIIMGNGTAVTGELHKATQTIPVVFNLTADPVGLGLIDSMARPGGNLTGFIFFEPPLVGKWFELLKQVAPGVAQTTLLFNPDTAGFYFKFFEGQPGLGTLIKLAPVRDMAEFETTLAGIAAIQGSSVIIPADPFVASNGAAIVKLVERVRLPAVYTYRQLAVDGGLMAYGPDTFAAFHQTADYVDRVLRGEKPSELPAQAPTKYQLVLNLASARKLNFAFPQTLLASADEVIE
jgi:putative tryptophan/tyrosine transport system substrate-binding protein